MTLISRCGAFRRPLLFCVAILLVPACNCFAADDATTNAKWTTQQPTVAESRARETKPQSADDASKPAEQIDLTGGPAPQWIWGARDERNYFLRKEFTGGSKLAGLIASCDNQMVVFINGHRVAESSNWQTPTTLDVQPYLQDGNNEVVVRAVNQGGPAGFVLKLALKMPDGKMRYVVSDESWEVADRRQSQEWNSVRTLGELGTKPWGDVFAAAPAVDLNQVPRHVFNVLPGFQVELLYTVPKDEQGSWVSLAFDDKGRLIASDQGDKGLYRITVPKIGSDEPTKVEKLDAKITSAQGLLHAFDSLYVSVNGGPGSGLYRARDTNGDDQYDSIEKLKALKGGGEHGPHAVRLSPDGKSLYLVAGNHTDPPEDLDASRLPANWDEDLLLPRQWDARGHARGRLAPGGWIAQVDPDGKTWEVFSVGYRNAYSIAFNADGELFAYDSDMEWDMGAPWYRPTRVTHATSGSEFGWRSGTGKWPEYYVDSLPPLLDIGPGSPVGVSFGYGTKFPAKYQRAIFILDWTFGTIYALHLTPDGASYKAEKEEFLSRTPLPLTDVAVGPDGAMYFAIGGRGTQSELFRVTYIGDESTAPVKAENNEFADLRALRQKLEQYHSPARQGAEVVDFLWPHLNHPDRHIRYAARVALEHQDTALWQDRALAEKNPQTLIQAAVALARQGDSALQSRLVGALHQISFAGLTESQQLDLLRAYGLIFIRMGEPDQATASLVSKKLDPFYPAETNALNRELCSLLAYLNSPTVVTKTLELMGRETEHSADEVAELLARNPSYGGAIAKMLANQPELEKIHYAFALRTLRYGWTLDQRREYFAWFETALQKSGGASYEGFINNIRKEALDNLSPAEKEGLAAEVIAPLPKTIELPKPQGPGRAWTVDDLVSLAQSELRGRSFENGKRAYAATRCIVCHRFDGEGGANGPDLTNLAGRFSVRDLAVAIVDPSKDISDQYRASNVLTTQGLVYSGRIVSENAEQLSILTDPEDATKIVDVKRSDIEEVTPSNVSLMPKDLLNVLNQDEVLDLLAYLMSRGNPNDQMFRGKARDE
jgi:putative heme-binding domain-containing protein